MHLLLDKTYVYGSDFSGRRPKFSKMREEGLAVGKKGMVVKRRRCGVSSVGPGMRRNTRLFDSLCHGHGIV